MTIDEALKLIQEDIDDKDVEWNSPLGKAYKLSFEALKHIKRDRELPHNPNHPLLPGETEE